MKTENEFEGPSEDALQVVRRLTEAQSKQGLTDKAFAREWLGVSDTVWNRIKSGEYWSMIKNPEPILKGLAVSEGAMLRELEVKARSGSVPFVKTEEYEAICQAIDECRGKDLTDPDRLIVYLARTGGGKTVSASRLCVDFKACVVEARQSWMRSYSSCLRDVAHAIGSDISEAWTPDLMEDVIIKTLLNSRRVVVIDEGEFFCGQNLNLLKLLLNKTRTVVVLCAIPEAYHRWGHRNHHEALQLRRRTHCVIELSQIKPETASRFFPQSLDADCARIAATYANADGSYDTLKRMASEFRKNARIARDDVMQAGERVRSLEGLKPLNPIRPTT